MKKLMIIALSAALLTGCGSPSAEDIKEQERFIGNVGSADIVTDTKTGCKYLFAQSGYAGGLSPLYKANGEIDCGEEE